MTESEREEVKILATQENLNHGTCLAKLPNDEIFCFGTANPASGISAIIGRDYDVRLLPAGTSCCYSSAIYFNNNIFCFGGEAKGEALKLSEKYDLDRYEWIKLMPLPQPDEYCHSIVYDGDILVSGYENRNLLRYSTKKNSFTKIDYFFAKKKRKILINSDRLYLIECNGMIYESETRGGYAWTQLGKSIIKTATPAQVYYEYSKGSIYIGVKLMDNNVPEYYKFSLDLKQMVMLGR